MADYSPLFDAAGGQHNVDPVLMQAIGNVESSGNPNLYGPVTSTGERAAGLMQFMPRTAAEYGVADPMSPEQAIPGATKKMSDLLNQHGDVTKALMAYNAGNPSRWNNPETQAYPGKVAKEYAKLAQAKKPIADAFSQSLSTSPVDHFSKTLDTAAPGATVAPDAQSSVPDVFSSTLDMPGPAQQTDVAAPQTTMGRIGDSIVRGVHQATDVPAAALAGGADWATNLLGYKTNFADDATSAPKQFNQTYDADPNNAGFVPSAARFAGNAMVTIPASIGAGRLVTGPLGVAGAAMGRSGIAANMLAPVASGAAQGATTAAMQGDSIKDGALVGGVAGGALGIVGAGVNKLIGSSSPAVEKAVSQYGIPLRAGQVADSKFARYADSQLSNLPLSGVESSNALQRTAFNTAVAKTFGADATQITPQVMQDAKNRIGDGMNVIYSRTTAQADAPLMQALSSIETTAQKTPSIYNDIRPHITDILDTAAANDGVIPGKAYQTLIGHNSALDRLQNSQNGDLRHFGGQIREALDDAFQRAAAPADQSALTQLRYQYKNMMTVAPLVNKGIPGDISPLLLQGAANRSFKANAFQGAGDLGELGDIGQQFLRPPPDSGTATRNAIMNGMYFGGVGAVRGAAGALGGLTVGKVLGANPLAGFQPPAAALPAGLLARNRLLFHGQGDGER